MESRKRQLETSLAAAAYQAAPPTFNLWSRRVRAQVYLPAASPWGVPTGTLVRNQVTGLHCISLSTAAGADGTLVVSQVHTSSWVILW
jgi:type II secretory pathway pseudopilin PulG